VKPALRLGRHVHRVHKVPTCDHARACRHAGLTAYDMSVGGVIGWAKERHTMQFDLACERTARWRRRCNGWRHHRILRRGSDMRTDNLASRRTKINNARGLASPSQIVVSHTVIPVILVVCRPCDASLLLAHGGCYGENIRPRESLRACTQYVDQAAECTAKKSFCRIIKNYIRDLTLINSRIKKGFQNYLNRIVCAPLSSIIRVPLSKT